MTAVDDTVARVVGTTPLVPTTEMKAIPAARDRPDTEMQIGVIGGGASAVFLIRHSWSDSSKAVI